MNEPIVIISPDAIAGLVNDFAMLSHDFDQMIVQGNDMEVPLPPYVVAEQAEAMQAVLDRAIATLGLGGAVLNRVASDYNDRFTFPDSDRHNDEDDEA